MELDQDESNASHGVYTAKLRLFWIKGSQFSPEDSPDQIYGQLLSHGTMVQVRRLGMPLNIGWRSIMDRGYNIQWLRGQLYACIDVLLEDRQKVAGHEMTGGIPGTGIEEKTQTLRETHPTSSGQSLLIGEFAVESVPNAYLGKNSYNVDPRPLFIMSENWTELLTSCSQEKASTRGR